MFQLPRPSRVQLVAYRLSGVIFEAMLVLNCNQNMKNLSYENAIENVFAM